jgi:hypothetical protein
MNNGWPIAAFKAPLGQLNEAEQSPTVRSQKFVGVELVPSIIGDAVFPRLARKLFWRAGRNNLRREADRAHNYRGLGCGETKIGPDDADDAEHPCFNKHRQALVRFLGVLRSLLYGRSSIK